MVPLASGDGKHLSSRIQQFQRRSQMGFKRAFTFGRCAPEKTWSASQLVGNESVQRPASRASVRSLGSLAAMNRLSLTTIGDDEPVLVQYRLHQASASSSPRTSYSDDSNARNEAGSRITSISAAPDAADFEVASEQYGFIPPMKRFAMPSSTRMPSEDWKHYLERQLQPEACRPSSRRLSASELVSPITESGKSSMKDFMDEDKFTSEEWAEFENSIETEAAKTREKLTGAVRVLPGTAKLVEIKKQFSPSSLSAELSGARPLTSADVDIIHNIGDLLSDAVSQISGDTGMRHDSLPYQAYSKSFDPFDEADVTIQIKRLESQAKPIYHKNRKCSIFQQGNTIELHLPAPGEALSSTIAPQKVVIDLNKTSWLDDSEDTSTGAPPVDTPQKDEKKKTNKVETLKTSGEETTTVTAADKKFGVITRTITNAASTVPPKFIMNDAAFPIFRRSTQLKPATKAMDGESAQFPLMPLASSNTKKRFTIPLSTSELEQLDGLRESNPLTRVLTSDPLHAAVAGDENEDNLIDNLVAKKRASYPLANKSRRRALSYQRTMSADSIIGWPRHYPADPKMPKLASTTTKDKENYFGQNNLKTHIGTALSVIDEAETPVISASSSLKFAGTKSRTESSNAGKTKVIGHTVTARDVKKYKSSAKILKKAKSEGIRELYLRRGRSAAWEQ